jgi:hypothetical protein
MAVSSDAARLEELLELKKRKYLEQKEAARKMNEALTDPVRCFCCFFVRMRA